MPITDYFTPGLATFIRDVGFPAFAFMVVLYIVNRMIKKDEKRQVTSDQNYKDLVKEFIDKMESITKSHTSALIEISSSNKETGVLVQQYTKEIKESREICIRNRDDTLDKILYEITELKDSIKEKFDTLRYRENENTLSRK